MIATLSEIFALKETHATLNALFMHAGAPGDPPDGSKQFKVQEWLRRVNRDESVDPMTVLGRLLEGYMDADFDDPIRGEDRREQYEKLAKGLARAEVQYARGGKIMGSLGAPSRTLQELIRDRDLPAIEEEFERALSNVEAKPREAVSAACNVLESVCKTYIELEGLQMPKKQDLKGVWDVVRRALGFDASKVEDRDLKEILGGLQAVVGGIGALRTHASSAHGKTAISYRVEPRHARLAVHSAHTMVVFVLESWDKKRAG